MKSMIRPAVVLFVVLSLITGLIYPLAVTATAKLLFPWQSQASLIRIDGKVAGSTLIGQSFSSNRYFWGRPSATADTPYNGMASGGSNLGPSHPQLKDDVTARLAQLQAAHPGKPGPIPQDLVTASASGLDPHISPAAARYQMERVANARALPAQALEHLIAQHTEAPQWGIFGEERVNVLKLNLGLDAITVN